METKAVLDTNVYLSALLVGGVPKHLLELALDGRFTAIVSPPILQEIKEKLIEKLHYPPRQAQAAVDAVLPRLDLVQVSGTLRNVAPDPYDNPVIETAIVSGAHFIVTGDRHLLNLKEYHRVKIVRITDFLRHLEQEP